MLTSAFCIAYLVFAAVYVFYSAYYVFFHVVLGIGVERALDQKGVGILAPEMDALDASAFGEPTDSLAL